MWGQRIIEETAQAMRFLPPDKLQEARDYVLALKARYGYDQPVDESDDWSDEDLRDVTAASVRRLEQEDPYEETDGKAG